METLANPSFVDLILRWGHVVFGIIWIGHLYFFNLVNVTFQGGLDKELKPKVNPALLLRAFWWFRWGAMYTFLFGLTLFLYDYIHLHQLTDATTGQMTGRSMWILWAMLLGGIMWFNVWFVIWPRQKLILGGLAARRREAGGHRGQGVAFQHLRLRAHVVRHARRPAPGGNERARVDRDNHSGCRILVRHDQAIVQGQDDRVIEQQAARTLRRSFKVKSDRVVDWARGFII
jgi:hypothetical protein